LWRARENSNTYDLRQTPCLRLVFPAALAEAEVAARNAQHLSGSGLVTIAGPNDALQNVVLDDRSGLPERELSLLLHQHHHLFEFEPFLLVKQLCVRENHGRPETSLQLGDIPTPGVHAEEIGKKNGIIGRERGKPQRPFAIIGSKEGDVLCAFTERRQEKLRPPQKETPHRRRQSRIAVAGKV
jgi:hypothetical protein